MQPNSFLSALRTLKKTGVIFDRGYVWQGLCSFFDMLTI